MGNSSETLSSYGLQADAWQQRPELWAQILQIHDMSRVTSSFPSGVLAFRYSLLSK
jgi:hypothetical protein